MVTNQAWRNLSRLELRRTRPILPAAQVDETLVTPVHAEIVVQYIAVSARLARRHLGEAVALEALKRALAVAVTVAVASAWQPASLSPTALRSCPAGPRQ
jgi:hypothetical protein